MDQKQTILDFIASHLLGVIATTNEDGKPQAALVGITELDTLELVFGTANTTRKYSNVMRDPHVAVAIGNSPEEATVVQYEGVAEELQGAELEQMRELHIKKNPRSVKYAHNPEQRFFKIKPTWIRYTNLKTSPKTIFELTF